MRTKFFRILVLALVVGLAMSCSNSRKERKEQVTVNFGNIPYYFEVMIAQKKGFFEEELAPYNAKVEISIFNSGPSAVEALATKNLDFASLGDQPALQAISSGVPVKIIAGISDASEATGLLTREDSGIKSVKDIKGKKIAAAAGTNTYQLLLVYLEKEGLTFDDIEYVNLTLGSIVPSLITDAIDGGIAYGTPFTHPPEGEGLVKVHSAAGYKRNVSVILARTAFTDKYPDITAGVLRALQKAAKWYVDNYDESIAIAAEWTGIERETLIKATATFITLLKLDKDAQDTVLSSADLLYKSDILSEKLTAEKIFDLKFQERAGLETFPGWGADRAGRITR